MIIATAGHVDHGKTLLVKALTGVDTDRLPEEKQRGLTIELGFAYHDLGDGAVTGFIDVPGHERFIRTMVAGVSGIDVVLFIIAADDGPMPQTEEHLAIIDLLGVELGVIALTKTDRVEAARLDQVQAQCRDLLQNTALAAAPIMPVSALTGAGISELRQTLIEVGARAPARNTSGHFRLAVDRSFILKGTGRVVTGTVFSGDIAVNQTAVLVPGAHRVRVRGIHAQNAAAEQTAAGQRAALNLTGDFSGDDIHRGDWVVDEAVAFTTQRLDARLRVLAGESRPLNNRTSVHVHIGAADVTGRVVTFDGQPIAPGKAGDVHLLLERPIHTVRHDRLVIRDQSARRTIGGGLVIDPLPDVRGRNREERLAYYGALSQGNPVELIKQAVLASPRGLDIAHLAQTCNWSLDFTQARVTQAGALSQIINNRQLAFTSERWQSLQDAVIAALKACHEAAPASAGATEQEIGEQLRQRLHPALLAALSEHLLQAKQLERAGGVWRLPGHELKRSPADEAMWQRVRPLLDKKDFKVPVVHDVHTQLNINLKLLEAFLQRSVKQGYVIKVSDKRYFLPETMSAFEDIVQQLGVRTAAGFSVADFRDQSGIGRNAVVEILEYFDGAGLTRREGAVRKVIKKSQ